MRRTPEGVRTVLMLGIPELPQRVPLDPYSWYMDWVKSDDPLYALTKSRERIKDRRARNKRNHKPGSKGRLA